MSITDRIDVIDEVTPISDQVEHWINSIIRQGSMIDCGRQLTIW